MLIIAYNFLKKLFIIILSLLNYFLVITIFIEFMVLVLHGQVGNQYLRALLPFSLSQIEFSATLVSNEI